MFYHYVISSVLSLVPCVVLHCVYFLWSYLLILCYFLFQRNITLHQLLSQLKSTTSAGAFNSALTTSFDSIKLEQLLDRGASGEVHRGVWQNNDVAVKVRGEGKML